MLTWKEIDGGSSAAPLADPPAPLVWREVSRPPSFYDELGLLPSASAAEIRQAFRRRALELHPDHASRQETVQKQAAHDAMARLNEVYRTLGSDQLRRAYDRSLA